MKIIVCVKQVPDTTEVRIDPIKGTLIREGVPSILNPDDKSALEEALKIKDKNPNTHITVLTMGPPSAETVLKECFGMGADEGILLTDRVFGGSDTWATANVLSAAIKKIGDYDIIFAGRQAIDGDTAQVGPQVAEKLGVPQVTYVQKLEVNKNELTIQRALEDGYEVVKAKTPILLTAIKELNEPRHMTLHKLVDAFRKKKIITWTNEDLNISADKIGLKSSPTNVKRTFTPEVKSKGMIIQGDEEKAAIELVKILKEDHLL